MISISLEPETQGLPIPLATTAAWLVIPPLAVKIPLAACIPWISSGDVSTLTKIVSCIMSLSLWASSEEKTTLPLAAPGDAGKPFAITWIELFSSKVGWSNVSKEFGSILNIAWFFEINFSLTISTAIFTADFDVLFPERVCKIQSLLFSTVNSTSCISL